MFKRFKRKNRLQTKNASLFDSANPAVDDDIVRTPLSKRILIGVICIIILLVFFGVLSFIKKVYDKPEDKERSFNALAVMAAPARIEDVQLTVEVQGESTPRTEINLVPEVAGKIVYVSPNFVEGGIISKGETLLRVEDSDYRVAVMRAQAQVAQAEQVLTREAAEGEIARQDWEELGTGDASPLTLRVPQRQQAEAALQASKGDLQAANLQLQRTYVRAPFTGRVRTKSSDIGQYVTPGSSLGRIFSTDIVQVRLPLSDTDLSRLVLPIAFVADSRSVAPKVTLSATVGGQYQEWLGNIMRTDSTYDTQSRALFAIVEVADPYGKGASQNGVPLAPGLFVNAKIQGREALSAYVIPRDGLRPNDEIYVVDDKGNAEIRTADVIDTYPDRAILRSGVSEGELVVLSPMERSRVSTPLKVLDFNDPTIVLVEPEKPEWLIAQEAEKEKAENDKDKPKDDGLSGKDKELLNVMFAKEYAEVKSEMTDADNDKFRKMSPQQRSAFMKRKLAEKMKDNAERRENGTKPDTDSQTSATETQGE
ncbi:efflux RND transporter periplasmic adaptor subunit [Robiginitomaculum antarcticum]|uniref:efflux RND transporter periplasmic adaptor subunit n=1 Tax=Robiginitomaculum antarcticum TaxID=437507 RepID=UPI000377EB59|nr:efflux RND transporter periplasmic adaptor subunit [Robiginitomaculum antarcticum]